MSSETELDEQLNAGIAELREAALDKSRLSAAEVRIVDGFRPSRGRQMRLFVLATSGLAAVFAGVVVLMPSTSVAAELERISQNANKGSRHLVQWTRQRDGSLRKGMEFYASGGLFRLVVPETREQIVIAPDELRTFYPDGAETVTHFPTKKLVEQLDWNGFIAKELLQSSPLTGRVKVSVDRGVVVDGRRVDRFTSDLDRAVAGGQTKHFHLVLLADPQTQRPIQAEGIWTGGPDRVTTWDFPSASAALVEGPTVDPGRVYDLDAGRKQILSALRAEGVKRTVHGVTVDLRAVVIDEHGDAEAITASDRPYPGNYDVRIDGHVVGDVPQTEAEARRYAPVKPTQFEGRKYQVFAEFRSPREPDLHLPDDPKVEIPILEGTRLVGYATYDHFPVIRAWKAEALLHTMTGYIWEPARPLGPPGKATPVEEGAPKGRPGFPRAVRG